MIYKDKRWPCRSLKKPVKLFLRKMLSAGQKGATHTQLWHARVLRKEIYVCTQHKLEASCQIHNWTREQLEPISTDQGSLRFAQDDKLTQDEMLILGESITQLWHARAVRNA